MSDIKQPCDPLCMRCDHGPTHSDDCRGAYDPDWPCRVDDPEEYEAKLAVSEPFGSPEYLRREDGYR